MLLRMRLKAEKSGKKVQAVTHLSSHTWSLPRSSHGLSPTGKRQGSGKQPVGAAPSGREQVEGGEWDLGQAGLGLAFYARPLYLFPGAAAMDYSPPTVSAIQGFHSHGFNQPCIEHIPEKKIPESTKSKTCICWAWATIHIAFALYL